MDIGDAMHKDELIQLHTLLWQIRNHLDDGITDNFKEYEEFGVIPAHIHKSKSQHKQAVFLLGKCLALAMDWDENNGNIITPSIIPKLSERMDNLAKRKTKDGRQSAQI
jgi:hypothetical protein